MRIAKIQVSRRLVQFGFGPERKWMYKRSGSGYDTHRLLWAGPFWIVSTPLRWGVRRGP